MKVCAISDLHGQLPEIEEADLLLIVGDIVPLHIQTDYDRSREWFSTKFKTWLTTLPVNKVLLIGGNHDGFICDRTKQLEQILVGTKCTYLENELFEYNGIKIFGSPWAHQFGNWWFMAEDHVLKELYSIIPDNVDILMVHDMPYECSDQCLGFPKEKDRELHRGNKPLQEILIKKRPIKFLGGHLHTCSHEWTTYYDADVICVSLLDEQYKMTFKPTYFEV